MGRPKHHRRRTRWQPPPDPNEAFLKSLARTHWDGALAYLECRNGTAVDLSQHEREVVEEAITDWLHHALFTGAFVRDWCVQSCVISEAQMNRMVARAIERNHLESCPVIEAPTILEGGSL